MKQLIITMLAVAALTGCSQNEELERGGAPSGEIRVVAGVDGTRTKALMDAGTGLAGASFIVKTGTTMPANNFSGGAAYTGNVAAGTGKVNFTTAPLYSPNGANAYMVAFFPGGTLTNNAIEWNIDGATDIMLTNAIWDAGNYSAPNTGETGTKLNFNHQLSRIEVVLKAESEANSSLASVRTTWGNVRKIEFLGAPTKMRYDLNTTPAVTTSGTTDFALLANYQGTLFTEIPIPANTNTAANAVAMLAPVTPTATESFILKITTAGDGVTPIELELPVSLDNQKNPIAAGYTHKVNMTFKSGSKQIEITTSTVTDWLPGDSGNNGVDIPKPASAAVGDYYYTDGTFSTKLIAAKPVAGIIYWVNSGVKTNYKVCSLNEPPANWNGNSNSAGILPWGNQSNSNMNNATDGMANMQEAKRGDPALNDYPAFKWCDSKNEGGSGWYLPATAELQHLYCASVGAPSATWGEDNTGIPSYDYGKRTIWNNRFTAVSSQSGQSFQTESYYTSECTGSSQSRSLNFQSGQLGKFMGPYCYIRCIKEVGKPAPSIPPATIEYGKAPFDQVGGVPGSTGASYNTYVEGSMGYNSEGTSGVLNPDHGEMPYKRFEVATEDETDGGNTMMTWRTAKNACAAKSPGIWRMPRLAELMLIRLNRTALLQTPGFTDLQDVYYWSGTEYTNLTSPWSYDIGYGNSSYYNGKDDPGNQRLIRCVREIP